MKKYIFISSIIFLGFATPVFTYGYTCMANATGNWNAAGTWVNCNSTYPQTGDDVVATSTIAITLTVNANTNYLKSLDLSGLETGGGTLAGTSNLVVQGLTLTTQNIIFGGTVSWTGVLNILPVSSTAQINLTTNGKLLSTIHNYSASNATTTLQDNLSFTAAKTNQFIIGTTRPIDMNGKTISGNSSTNRVLIKSYTIGSPVTKLNVNGGAFANADFRDIAFNNGGSNLDLSAITGLSGDCGGNSMTGGGTLTFTTATTTYWIGGTGSWSDTNEWAWGSGLAGGTSRVPLPQDDVVFDNGSFSGAQTVTNDMPRAGKNINWSAYNEASTPVYTLGSQGTSFFGSLTNNSNMTVTELNYATTFEGRGSYTLTSAGKPMPGPVYIYMPGGTLTLQDSMKTGSTARALSIEYGTFNANGYNVTFASVARASSNTTTWNLGSGTWTVSSTGSVWNTYSPTGLTILTNNSTIVISNTSATSKTFTGSGKTYSNIIFSGDNITVAGSNTFSGTFALNNAGLTNGLKLTAGTTQTVGGFTSNGVASSLAKMVSATGGSVATISKSSGQVCEDYMSLQDITATGGAGWYAGANSTNVSGNSGWTFTACPASANTVSNPTKKTVRNIKMIIRKGTIIFK